VKSLIATKLTNQLVNQVGFKILVKGRYQKSNMVKKIIIIWANFPLFCNESFYFTCVFMKNMHYNKKRAYCNPNILANNKEIRFRKPAILNTNSSQTLKPLRNPHLRTRTIASSSQLPKLNPLQHISDYNVFYTRFAIHSTSKIIENKSNIAKT